MVKIGQNTELLKSEQLGLESGIDGGFDAFAVLEDLGLTALEHVEDGVAEDGQVHGREIFSGTPEILVEGNIQSPVKIVINGPMRPDGHENCRGVGGQRGGVKACFGGQFPGFLIEGCRCDRGNAAQLLPLRMQLFQPIDILCHAG
jgi:hypothetical protein